jgi:hypothetical protein
MVHVEVRGDVVVDLRELRDLGGDFLRMRPESRPPGLPESTSTLSPAGVTISVEPPPSESIQ